MKEDTKNYTKRETDAYRKSMTERMDKQDDMLNKIFDQTSKTNVRVTKLEDKTSGYSDLEKKVDAVFIWKSEFMAEVKGMKRVLIVMFIVIPSLISTIFYLYINNFKHEVIQQSADTVVSTLEEKYNLKINE